VDAPLQDIDEVARSTERLLAAIAGIDDGEARAPSALPGWSRGHLLTHLARNADSHVRRTAAALRGEVVDQYAGGPAGRAAEIEAGAGRPAADLLEDVRASAAELAAAWAAAPAHGPTWDVVSRDGGGTERRLKELPGRRWQELEVHLLDLDVGADPDGWSEAFVRRFLPLVRPTMERRLPRGAAPPAAGSLDERAELAWLYGRLQGPDLPELAPWG
jgi:maleylpyruvate isomerase